MKITLEQKKELLRLLVWGVIGVITMFIMVVFFGCTTPKNIDRNTHVDYSNNLHQMQNRMDSLLFNMKLMQRETSERLTNLNVENKTVYLSPPDSTGKQYPTQVSETTVNKQEKENKTTDTKIEATMQLLIREVNDIKQQLNTSISEKEKVIEVSWWQLHKVDVYAGMYGFIILGGIIYKVRKK